MSRFMLLTLTVVVLVASGRVWAADAAPGDWWGLHGQSTFVTQYHPGFHAAFSGTNSLDPQAQARETFDLTLYGGLRLWRGAALWVNPEVDQGFGLSNTLGVAGFTSGEAYKVGQATPYFQLPRLFVRQTINLGGEVAHIDAGLNQLAGSQTAHRVVVTVGKFAVVDVFDTKTLQLVQQIQLSERPNKIAVNKKHRKIYAGIVSTTAKVAGPGFKMPEGRSRAAMPREGARSSRARGSA